MAGDVGIFENLGGYFEDLISGARDYFIETEKTKQDAQRQQTANVAASALAMSDLERTRIIVIGLAVLLAVFLATRKE